MKLIISNIIIQYLRLIAIECYCKTFVVFVLFCRKREEDLAKAHQKEIDSLTADHLRETQALLTEFNRAKELLSDKISALQLM